MINTKQFFNKYSRYCLAILIGGITGFLYYFFIGCNSGTCSIASNPYKSIAMGCLMGFIWVFSSGKQEKGAE